MPNLHGTIPEQQVFDPELAPYTGWSPIPDKIPGISAPVMQPAACPFFPVSCGTLAMGKCVVPAQQPVVPVPVYQEIKKRDRIIEVPQTVITDKVIPKLQRQEVVYEVPNLNVLSSIKEVKIPRVEFRIKEIEVPVPVRYNYKVISKWDVREVPKLVPKYTGVQEEILIEVPQVKVVDRCIEKEVPVYVGERIVKTMVYEEVPYDIVQYKYVEKFEDVPVYKYKPVLDVEVDIPPPLIVPVPVQPKEVQLEPERISLDDWKKTKLGSNFSCCNPTSYSRSNSGHAPTFDA